MLHNGNHNDAKQFNFGIRHKGNLCEIRLRFKTDIANYISERLTAKDLMITNESNKGCRTIYGHCTPFERDQLMKLKRLGKGNRLMEQALELLSA
jgi:hypothetical protein